MRKLSEPASEIATQAKIKDLLQLIDRSRPKEEGCLSEQDGSEFFGRSGLSYPDPEAPITLLCETASETYYFRSGLFYRSSRAVFYEMVRGIRPINADKGVASHNNPRLKPMEVEFVLGTLSAIDPLSSWSLIGIDLLHFVIHSRKNLDKWSLELASLLLTQQMLKKYARRLYQKIFRVLMDGAWSKLPDSVSTDDTAIARFAGYLLGSYRSEELMDRMIHAHWAISFQVLKRFSAVAKHQLKGLRKHRWQRKQIEILCRSFHKVGVQVTGSEVQSYLNEIKTAADEIGRIVQILQEGAGRRKPGNGARAPKPTAPRRLGIYMDAPRTMRDLKLAIFRAGRTSEVF